MADKTVSQAAPRRGRINWAVVDATTEADLARFNAEDGFDPDDTMAGLAEVLSPAEIRHRVGLTQVQIAERIAVPLRTWRNWE